MCIGSSEEGFHVRHSRVGGALLVTLLQLLSMLIGMHICEWMETKRLFLQICYLDNFMTMVSKEMKLYDYRPLNYSKHPCWSIQDMIASQVYQMTLAFT